MSRLTTRCCREIFTLIASPPRITAKRSATTRRRSGSTRITRSPTRSYRSRQEVWPTTTSVLRRRKDKRRSQRPVPQRRAHSIWIRISPIRMWRKAIELQPQSAENYTYLAIIQILRGNSGPAVELAKQETDPFWRTYALALAHFANGDRAEADAALKKLIDENADDGGSQIAQVYALRKDPEKMFEWLEHAWTTHDSGATELLSNPFLLAYKDDPRFIAFAQKIGVMPKTAAKP